MGSKDERRCPVCGKLKNIDEFIETAYDGMVCKVCYVDYWEMVSDEEDLRTGS